MYGKAVIMASYALFMLVLLFAFIAGTPGTSLGANPGTELGLPEDALAQVDETTLDQARGRYFDLFFSISLTGYWRHDDPSPGFPGARLVYSFGFGEEQGGGDVSLIVADVDDDSDIPCDIDPPAPVPPPVVIEDPPVETVETVVTTDVAPPDPDQDTETLAIINGGFTGGSGAFQVTQVPGSGNIVTTGMAINLWMLNVQETATAERVRSALTEMLNMSY
ncbi:MAG: hypothetical protein Tsb0017_09980 [Geothermobacteraceae bacterium]